MGRRLTGVAKIEYTRQDDDYSCGLHAAFAVLKRYKKARSINGVRRRLRLFPIGTEHRYMVHCLRGYGVKARTRPDNQMTMKELEHNLARGGMVITVMKYSDTQTHYVVVHGMSKHNVYLADGARLYTPSGRITRRHFRRLWTRGGITTQP